METPEIAEKLTFPAWATAGIINALEESPAAAFTVVGFFDDKLDVWDALRPHADIVSKALANALEHSDEDVRQAAVEALGALDAKDQTAAIAARLEDSDENVRQAAVQALLMLNYWGVIPAAHALNRAESEVRDERAESRAIAHLFAGDDEGIKALVNWTGAPPDTVIAAQLAKLNENLAAAQNKLQLLGNSWDDILPYRALREELGGRVSRIAYTVCDQAGSNIPQEANQLRNERNNFASIMESAENLVREIRVLASSTCWTKSERATLVAWEQRLRNARLTSSADSMEKHIDGMDRFDWAGIGLEIWAYQIVLWVGLVALYPWPRARPVRAFFVWNKWPRRFIGFFYVGFLLAYIPPLRRLLFRPFRRSLLADAGLEHFREDQYFGGSTVRDEHGAVRNLLDAIPDIRGQIVLEGVSGTGKSMYLRLLAKRSRRVVAFLPAQLCEGGVMEAIAAKLPGLPADDTYLQQLISAGAIDVIIDGINEVSVETRGKIDDFVQRHFEGNIILSSQPMEWAKPQLARQYTLLPLSRDQIEDYLTSREPELPEASTIRGDDFQRRARTFLAHVFNEFDAREDQVELQTALSNPMDLTLVAQILGQGRQPDLMAFARAGL